MSAVEFIGSFTLGALCMLAFLFTFGGVIVARSDCFVDMSDGGDDDDLGHQH